MCDLWVLKTCRASVKVTVQNQPTTWMDDAASVVKMRRNCISFSHSLSSFSFIHAFSLSHPFIASFSYTLIPSHSLSLEAAWVEGGMKPQRAKRQHMPSSWGPPGAVRQGGWWYSIEFRGDQAGAGRLQSLLHG